jgi:mono/diheme cytochrome c family protein
MLSDPPLTDGQTSIKRILMTILGLVLAFALVAGGIYAIRLSDPYVRDVLALQGNPDRGYAMFQLNCAGCHGNFGDGKVGPSLHHVRDRRSQIGLIRQVTTGKTPPMPKFQVEPEKMADLLSYLNTL